MEKMIKIAKGLDIAAKIIFVCCIVALCILLAANIVAAVVPEEFVENGIISFKTDFGISFIFADGFDPGFTKTEIMAFLISASVTVAVAIITFMVGIKMFREILEPMKFGKPFEEGISKKLLKFGTFVLAATIIVPFIQAIFYIVFSAFNHASLQGFEAGADGFTLNADGIIIAVIIYLVGYIFRYGEELQKQADETL